MDKSEGMKPPGEQLPDEITAYVCQGLGVETADGPGGPMVCLSITVVDIKNPAGHNLGTIAISAATAVQIGELLMRAGQDGLRQQAQGLTEQKAPACPVEPAARVNSPAVRQELGAFTQ